MNFRSIRDLTHDLLTWELPANIEVIVGIPRSGLLAANIMSLHRNIPFTDLGGFLADRMLGVGATKKGSRDLSRFLQSSRRALILDDSLFSGREMRCTREAIAKMQLRHELSFAAVYMNPGREREVDYYRRLLPMPRIFEWNLLHSVTATKGCWDIDGVLCRDPTRHENDDGSRYAKFLSEVPLRIRPSQTLGWIVTSRLEKYRAVTEDWLAGKGIKFRHLVMLDLPNKQSRVAAGCHASFKASAYMNTPASIFVESSYRQAVEIARLSGKYTICFDTQECIVPGTKAKVIHECRDMATVLKRRIRSRFRRLKSRFKRLYISGTDGH